PKTEPSKSLEPVNCSSETQGNGVRMPQTEMECSRNWMNHDPCILRKKVEKLPFLLEKMDASGRFQGERMHARYCDNALNLALKNMLLRSFAKGTLSSEQQEQLTNMVFEYYKVWRIDLTKENGQAAKVPPVKLHLKPDAVPLRATSRRHNPIERNCLMKWLRSCKAVVPSNEITVRDGLSSLCGEESWEKREIYIRLSLHD